MPKKKKRRNRKPKLTIKELEESRDGGQIALRGYSYQILYSCYLMVNNSDPNISFQLEGVEDIDCIQIRNEKNNITHIQLKYSSNKQRANFLKDVLKNYLEAYLLDKNRLFKLIYDFPVADGHLKNIVNS